MKTLSVRHLRARPSAISQLLLLLAATLLGCQGCEERPVTPPAAQGMASEAGGSARPVDIELEMPVGVLPEGLEFGPAETQPWLRSAGTLDARNRYAATVMIGTGEPMKSQPLCSGVLVEPQLVLTAGSCVCRQKPPGTPSARKADALGAAPCIERVLVTMVLHGEEEASVGKELAAVQRFLTYGGSVRPHPELELALDARGSISSRRADLAAVALDEPVKERFGEVLLSETEVREGEALVMAGYGDDETLGGSPGDRYFRKNKAMRAPTTGSDLILYEQQGPYVYNGFAGGPCFREDGRGQWLVGIAGVSREGELSCTSTYVHREWVHAEITRSRTGSDVKP